MGARSDACSRSLIGTSATLAAGLVLAACGGAGHATKVKQSTSAAPSATAPVAAVQPVRLRILSPKAGAHTGATLKVRVLLTGSSPGHQPSLRYVLDGAVTRRGSAQLTLQALRPGRHRLEVMLTQDHRIRAGSLFTVRLPPPPVKAAPVAAPEPAPIVTATSPPPSPSGGIPQGGGGDGDGDNSGGPSDGDGNV